MYLTSLFWGARTHCYERDNQEGDGTESDKDENSPSEADQVHTQIQKPGESNDPDDLSLRPEDHLKGKLSRLDKALIDATNQIQRHIQTERGLRARLDEVMQQAEIARISQISTEERFRRQSEILERTVADLNERNDDLNKATTKNASLLMEQMKFMKWNEPVDDDEISHTVRRLYQEIETWIKRHFQLPPDDFCWLYSIISDRIFKTFLVRMMVGLGGADDSDDQSLSHTIEALSKEVQNTCPSNVGQHWLPATSKAAFSMNSHLLSSECEGITQWIEDQFGEYSQTSFEKRTEGLNLLVWKFVEFKARLETQNDRYEFFEFLPGTAFNEQEMASYTGLSGSGIVVYYTLAHALFKISAKGDRTLVQKARVVTKRSENLTRYHH